jgi:hypothetical protein
VNIEKYIYTYIKNRIKLQDKTMIPIKKLLLLPGLLLTSSIVCGEAITEDKRDCFSLTTFMAVKNTPLNSFSLSSPFRQNYNSDKEFGNFQGEVSFFTTYIRPLIQQSADQSSDEEEEQRHQNEAEREGFAADDSRYQAPAVAVDPADQSSDEEEEQRLQNEAAAVQAYAATSEERTELSFFYAYNAYKNWNAIFKAGDPDPKRDYDPADPFAYKEDASLASFLRGAPQDERGIKGYLNLIFHPLRAEALFNRVMNIDDDFEAETEEERQAKSEAIEQFIESKLKSALKCLLDGNLDDLIEQNWGDIYGIFFSDLDNLRIQLNKRGTRGAYLSLKDFDNLEEYDALPLTQIFEEKNWQILGRLIVEFKFIDFDAIRSAWDRLYNPDHPDPELCDPDPKRPFDPTQPYTNIEFGKVTGFLIQGLPQVADAFQVALETIFTQERAAAMIEALYSL